MKKIKIKLPEYCCRNGGMTEHEYYLLTIHNGKVSEWVYVGGERAWRYDVKDDMKELTNIYIKLDQEQRMAMISNLKENTLYDVGEIMAAPMLRKLQLIRRLEKSLIPIQKEIEKLKKEINE